MAAAALAGAGLGAWLFAGPPARALENNSQIISGGVGIGGGTVFVTPSGPGNSADFPSAGIGESVAQAPFPAGTLSKLRVKLFTQNVPTGGSLSVMVRVNGADTTLTCSLTASGVCTSGNKTKSVNNNGLVALRLTSDLTDAAHTQVSYTLQFD
jgi:hypothetical protein